MLPLCFFHFKDGFSNYDRSRFWEYERPKYHCWGSVELEKPLTFIAIESHLENVALLLMINTPH